MEQNNQPSNRQLSPTADHEQQQQQQQPSTYTNAHISSSSPEKWDQHSQHGNTVRNGASSPYSTYPSYSQQHQQPPPIDLSHQRDSSMNIWNGSYPSKPLQVNI